MKTVSMSEADFEEHLHNDVGVCVECHGTREGCEPDAREYKCPSCGLSTVYGVEWLMVAGDIEFIL